MKKTIYLIENGEIFDGGEGQLGDCFGIYPSQFESWCEANDWSFEVKEIDETDPRFEEYF